jgi:hypothetical protein
MEKNAIIDSIELFLKTDAEIKKLFQFAINDRARETKNGDLKASITWREQYKETLCEEIELSPRQVKHFSPKKAKEYIERGKVERKERSLEKAKELALDKALEANIANKNLAIAEFNRLVREASNSPLLVWLAKDCLYETITTKLERKKVKRYMPYEYMENPFTINDEYSLILLARIIANPLLNYLTIPDKLPDKATFQRAGKLSEELLNLIEKHQVLTPFNDNILHTFKTVLSQIGVDHLSQTNPQDVTYWAWDKGRGLHYEKTAEAYVRPVESLKEIKYEELRKHKTRLLIEDMGIRYINTFYLGDTSKGRPHPETILNLVPQECVPIDEMPDIRSVQRWLKDLDGYGITNSISTPLNAHRPFTSTSTRKGQEVPRHVHINTRYIRRFVNKPNIDDLL